MLRYRTNYILLFILITSLIFINSYDGYAVSGQNPVNLNKTQTAYTIVLPGEDIGGNMFSKAKIYEIPLLSRDHYAANSIIVKTKNRQVISPSGKKFGSSILNSSVEDLGIKNLRAPYEKYGQAGNHSKDYTGISRIYEIKYAAPVDPYDVCRELMKNPEIEYAVPQFYSYPTEFTPNDPQYNKQYALKKIEAEKAWDISKGESEVLIAIIDTGIDWTHEDLIENIWINPGEVPGDGIDNDGNGKIDDVRGWDFVGDVTRQEFYSGQLKPDNDPKPVHPSNNHGTHVTGCASATTDNGKGVASPGFYSKVLPIKCSADNSNAVNKLIRTYEAMMYAAELGADVINASWGGPGFSPYNQDVINQVTDMGTLVVAAAGNDHNSIDDGSFYPAGYDNVLSVGATRSNDRKAGFSNYGYKVTVFSPGVGILATNPGNKYGNNSGTSMASPVLAGVASLVVDVHRDWSPKQIIHQIRSTSDNVVAPNESLRPIQYGRVNAFKALSYNSASFPESQVPGVGISEQYFFDGDIIQNYDEYTVRYTLTNYLAGVTGLSVKVTPLDYFVSVDRENVSIGNILTGSSKKFTLNVQLSDETPWYVGTAKLLFTYQADGYTDYELVSIPFKLPSPNVFKHIYEVPNGNVSWNGVSSPSRDVFWGVGTSNSNGKGVFYRNGSQRITTLDDAPATAIHAFDTARAVAAISPAAGDAMIATTTNGGTNWNKQNVGSIADFINDIHFFDEQNGLFLADPKNNTWRVGRTTNAGADWSSITNLPKPLSEETSTVEASCRLDDNVWFGTNQGRVIYTTDRGSSWQSSTVSAGGGMVRYIAFVNKDTGMVAYSESPDMKGPWIASLTLDGGQTWKQKYDFTEANNYRPASMYSPPNSSRIIVTMQTGEIIQTTDLGRNWAPILTYKYSNITAATAVTSNQDIRLWTAGADISYLDFTYMPDNATRVLNITTGNAYDFDTVDIGTKNTGKIGLENLGNVILNINDISFSYTNSTSDEFYLFLSQPDDIQPGKSENITLRFAPQNVGRRDAVLIIRSDAAGSPDSVNLTGYVIDPSSVAGDEIESAVRLNVVPNPPAAGKADIYYNLETDRNVIIDIIDFKGRKVVNIFNGLAFKGENQLSMNAANWAPGVYFVTLSDGEHNLRKKFVVVE